jgi:hypothetical protein
MKRKDQLKSRHLAVQVTPDQYAFLQEQFRSTIYRVFSEYIRTLLLQKPVTVRYRSQSLDEFLQVAIALKNELRAIGKSFCQSVEQIKIKSQNGEFKDALEFFAAEEFSLLQKMEEIRNLLIKIHEQCSQK